MLPNEYSILKKLLALSLIIGMIVQPLFPTASAAGYYNPAPSGVVVPTPADFHSYATLTAELLGVNVSDRDIASLEIIGNSTQDRSIFALRITEGNAAKQNVLFMGLHHANEWMSLEQVIYLARYFLANAHVTPRIDAILQKANVWFIPLVNPDGFEHSRIHDNLWRKNRRDNGDGTFGVDLNRNYGYNWNTGSIPTNTSDIEYPGPAPFSEPETQAVRDFAINNSPVLSISYHTAGGWILFPWSYTQQPTSNDGLFRGIAQEMSAYDGYKLLQEGKSNHVKPGNSDDWLYREFGTLAYTIELGPSFSSQDPNQMNAILLSNVEPALISTEIALHIRALNCIPSQLLCIPSLSLVTVGVPLLVGSIYFGVRITRRMHERENDPDYQEPMSNSQPNAIGISSFSNC